MYACQAVLTLVAWHSLQCSMQIFDFVNVNNIHNATFADELPPTFSEQAYALANFHENGVFTDIAADGIGNGQSSVFSRGLFLNLKLTQWPSAQSFHRFLQISRG